jgi:uncharacterized membrane protein/nitrite reductase/ring-hydroxylating ferredoxin subunit
MKSKAVLLGHPLHSMLVPFPVAFLTGTVAFDGVGWLKGVPSWWITGGHLLVVGIAAAVFAALPGLVDYRYTVPPHSSAKSRATKHLIVNLSGLAFFVAAWWIRGGAATKPDAAVLGLEVMGLALLSSGAYLGGTLVTRNLIGVDHRYARAGRWREEAFEAPAGGPIAVAKSAELKVDQMKLLRVGSQRVVLARTERGYVAFDDRCTHKGGSLAGGVMACGTVHCLWHGSQFDVESGGVKAGPARAAIGVHRVKEGSGEVKLVLREHGGK